ncbi:unnamed protein product [Cyprideis torosa]|uniref:Uncharacterized protein n=1 Tax=Cyprideis torosa TaxID=163714 RepID=A0A7R8ZNN8_9CRUS|nr:unnamed protein product [Cyprideis torosa]CAG0898445.1 unnamed protein product [Cyprideis torosa]
MLKGIPKEQNIFEYSRCNWDHPASPLMPVTRELNLQSARTGDVFVLVHRPDKIISALVLRDKPSRMESALLTLANDSIAGK